MTIDHLHRFLVDYQLEKDATREDAMSILHSLRHRIMYKKELNLDHFFRYILSDHNPPIAPSLGVIRAIIYTFFLQLHQTLKKTGLASARSIGLFTFELAVTFVS